MDEDAELIERFLRGDRNAGSLLVARHSPTLFCWLRWKTGSREDAEDLTQIVWSKAVPALTRLDDRTRLRPWLFTIMRREFTNWLREHQPTCSLEALGEAGSDTLESLLPGSPQNEMDSVEDRIALENALAQLSEEHRDTFMLRYLSQFSAAEVASILDVPVGTVESRCHFARERLRKWLLNTGEDRNVRPRGFHTARWVGSEATSEVAKSRKNGLKGYFR